MPASPRRPVRGKADDKVVHTAAASRRTPRAAATPHGASELARRLSPRWPVVGRKPKSAAESVGPPQKRAIHLLNHPPYSRNWCRSEPRER